MIVTRVCVMCAHAMNSLVITSKNNIKKTVFLDLKTNCYIFLK